MKQLVRSFGFSAGVSLAALGYVLFAMGIGAGVVTLILAAIELAFSFDNAVINAKILMSLSPLWRRLFLSVGIVIAIFGVRALFPILIVSLAGHLPLRMVADLALHDPTLYAGYLQAARPAITAFGGAFLLMLSLQFFFSDRDVKWLKLIERPLARFESWWLPLIITTIVVLAIGLLPGNHHADVARQAGIVGLLAYALINGAIALMNRLFDTEGAGQRIGLAAFTTFLYLEVLDASLSFDGVIGAFAITNDVVLIALGLGIGAVWVRSITVYIVRHKTLEAFKFLEHGAHYAITVLAVTMLLGVIVEVPDLLTGILCLGLIAAAVVTSRQAVEEVTHARHG